MHIYIYIYIYRERERERESWLMHMTREKSFSIIEDCSLHIAC